MSRQSLGQKIQSRRKEMDYSQDRVAAFCGKTQQWLARVEAGAQEITLIDTLQLSRMLGIPVEEIAEERGRA